MTLSLEPNLSEQRLAFLIHGHSLRSKQDWSTAGACSGLSVSVPQNVYVGILAPKVLVSGGGLWGDEVVRVEPS